jgi:hypothetical protein
MSFVVIKKAQEKEKAQAQAKVSSLEFYSDICFAFLTFVVRILTFVVRILTFFVIIITFFVIKKAKAKAKANAIVLIKTKDVRLLLPYYYSLEQREHRCFARASEQYNKHENYENYKNHIRFLSN